MEQEQITVIIQEQEYKIKCEPAQVELLQKSAMHLDMKMSEIKTLSPNMAKDKVAIMTALNIVSKYLGQEDQIKEYSNACDDISMMTNSLNEFGTDK
ncbi:MAG: cell division protein ZapA [Gammaproteobacteria bacterium]|jgi:cell division protein ZapA (FtsZ GTPase activity inhibitor)|nr:cell division protein ZapA [Gammaproteobacteria bacterium]MBT4462217.1 cell division protein ZapA [Gammaproteobacteria bacterium]MBT4654463.1 cell division protein ZapA [Gammaproteobacteria bacterium]MBT5116875.1 cell division protein ZapA [Gammaproteobacteria bacterium]MBT5761961.1 cell division protein ZapA [Gammaproteobacteria bacterium]